MYSLPTDDFRQYINGELVSGRGRTTQIRCPGNGEPVAQIALATKEQAQQALEAFTYSVHKYIGAYAAAMNGLDVLTFTAGVGENGPDTRASVCSYLEFLGVKLDPERNKVRGEEALISADDSRVKVWVIPTNEELMIAQDTAALCGK